MDPFIGEIRLFAGNFPPRGWAFCEGQLLSITQNTALFSIIGTIYGGDGKSTFALPDLRGRATMHQGQGVGLTSKVIGEFGGTSAVTLTESEMTSHKHRANCQNLSSQESPIGGVWGDTGGKKAVSVYSDTINTQMSPQTVQQAGGSQPHNNMQPYLGLNFIIALEGVFPPRS